MTPRSIALVAATLFACRASYTAPSPLAQLRRSTSPEQAAVVESLDRFSVALYPLTHDAVNNAAISPASVFIAVAMTSAGARGETASQMSRALQLRPDQPSVHTELGRIVAAMTGATGSSAPVFRIANRLYGEQSFAFHDEFIALTRDDYGAAMQPVDFIHAADPSRLAINQWVEDQTAHKIVGLLPPDSVTDATRIVLVDAVYLLARWQRPFAPGATRDAPFHLLDGATANVPTMTQHHDLLYGESGPVHVLELPYLSSGLAMDVILPTDPRGLVAVERDMTAQHLDAWLGSLRERAVTVYLPRFRAHSHVALNAPLAALGIRDAFDPSRADLSGIGARPHDLFVSTAVHQAYVDTDEQGTEAAAATGVIVEATSARVEREPPVEFRADHPFLFVLRDTRTQVILFMGRVARPQDRGE